MLSASLIPLVGVRRLAVMKMKKEPEKKESKTIKNAASVWVATAARTNKTASRDGSATQSIASDKQVMKVD